MQLLPLTSDLEGSFWNVVETDCCDYYFFIYDWLQQRAKTKIFLAQENSTIAGLMVIYNEHIVQLRGDNVAIEFMLQNLPPEAVEVQVPLNSEKHLLAKFPSAKLTAHVTLMRLDKGYEQLFITVKPQKLAINDSVDIAQLMHQCYPEMWSDISTEAVEANLCNKDALWLGIKEADKLVAFGYAMLTSKTCHVTWIGTSPQYENKGYATSIVSALAQECLTISDTTVIYVMENNPVANHIYSRVGFKPYKQYAFVKA